MKHPDSAAAESAMAAIAPLQRRVLGWIDADLVLPADGSSLLAALERAQAGLTERDPTAARAGIGAFICRVEALIDAGALEAEEGRARVEAAAAMSAMLRSTMGTDLETRRDRRVTDDGPAARREGSSLPRGASNRKEQERE